MSRVAWTPVAESDLDDILYYISVVDRSPETGQRIFYEIRDRVVEHVKQSLPGHRHQDAPQGWIYIKHKRWMIFYTFRVSKLNRREPPARGKLLDAVQF